MPGIVARQRADRATRRRRRSQSVAAVARVWRATLRSTFVPDVRGDPLGPRGDVRYPRTMAKPTKSAPKTNEVPIHATHFDLWKLTRRTGVGTNGKKYRTWEPKRLTGAPDAQGRVTNRWLLSELSPVTVRRRWGAGRFRVRYSNEAGDVLGATDWELETPESERQGDPIDGAPSAGASEDGAHVGGSGASADARSSSSSGPLSSGFSAGSPSRRSCCRSPRSPPTPPPLCATPPRRVPQASARRCRVFQVSSSS